MSPTEEFLTAASGNLQTFFSGHQWHARNCNNGHEVTCRNTCSIRDRQKKSRFTSTKIQPQSADFLYNEIFSFLFARGVAGAKPDAAGCRFRIAPPGTSDGSRAGCATTTCPCASSSSNLARTVAQPDAGICASCLSDGLIEAHDTIVYKAAARRELPGLMRPDA